MSMSSGRPEPPAFQSLSRALNRRVLILSLIGMMGLLATIVLGLSITLSHVQTRMDSTSLNAIGIFDRFFLELQSDLKGTADGLASRNDQGLALLTLRTRNRALLDAWYLDPQGAVLARRSQPGMTPLPDPDALRWLRPLPPYGQVVMGQVRFEGETPYVEMAATVTDELSLPQGLLVVKVDLSTLWNKALDIKVGESGYAYLADSAGQLVAWRNRRLMAAGTQLEMLLGRKPEAIVAARLSLYRGLNGGYVLASAQPLRVVPWFAVLEQPVLESLGPFGVLALVMLIGLCTVAILVDSTRRFMASRVLSPLHALRDSVRQMADGHLEQEVPVLCQDELGQLTKSINRMARQLQASFRNQAAQISDLREAQAGLRDSQDFLDTIVNNLPLMVFVKDARDLRFVRINRAGEELLGHLQEDLVGKNDRDFFPEAQAASFEAADRAVLSGAQVFDIPVEAIQSRTHGERLLHTLKVPILDGQGIPVYLLGISEDITERQQSREDNRKLQAQLYQSQKMEGLGTLAGGVAHDMNNVLGAILGLASAQRRIQPVTSDVHQALETICRAAERGGTLVSSLLRFARQSPAEEREVDLNAIIREEVSLLERTTLAKVSLVVDLMAEPSLILGDARALTHAIMNLCVNAVDAMPAAGTLTLRTRAAAPDWIEVRVEDTGSGMSQEVMDRALDPFFTTKAPGKGTGLGLSLVYSTVKAHRGQMDLQSEPGAGTVISLRFPALRARVPALEAAPRQAKSDGPGKVLAVLIIDDDELIRKSLATVLQILGHPVTTAACGEEALLLLEGGYLPEVIILDMNMPGLGGVGTLPRLRALLPAVPVLLATGRVDQAALDLSARFDQVTLLSKPFGILDLERHLAAIG